MFVISNVSVVVGKNVNKMFYFILKMKLKRFIYFLFLFVAILTFYQVLYVISFPLSIIVRCRFQLFYNFNNPVPVDRLPRLIWWTPFTLREDLEEIRCDNYRCAATDNRKYFNDSSLQVRCTITAQHDYLNRSFRYRPFYSTAAILNRTICLRNVSRTTSGL